MMMKRNVWKKKGKSEVVMLVTLCFALAPLLVLPAYATSAVVSIDDIFMEADENAVTQITINNVSYLGVADITLTFDPSVVHIVSVTNSDFDFLWPVINNSAGTARIGGMDYGDGLYGNVKFGEVTFKAVGEHGEISVLNMSLKELKEAGPIETTIPATVDKGTAYINLPPVAVATSLHLFNHVGSRYPCNATFIASDSYDPDNDIITNYNWSCGDGYSSEGATIEHEYSSWNWNGTGYEPFNVCLTVKDAGGLINTSILQVNVFIAGDVDGNGRVNILDAVYIGKHWNMECLGDRWSTDQQDRADLNNDCVINILDAVRIGAKWGDVAW